MSNEKETARKELGEIEVLLNQVKDANDRLDINLSRTIELVERLKPLTSPLGSSMEKKVEKLPTNGIIDALRKEIMEYDRLISDLADINSHFGNLV